jgi:hypothetical protein
MPGLDRVVIAVKWMKKRESEKNLEKAAATKQMTAHKVDEK